MSAVDPELQKRTGKLADKRRAFAAEWARDASIYMAENFTLKTFVRSLRKTLENIRDHTADGPTADMACKALALTECTLLSTPREENDA